MELFYPIVEMRFIASLHQYARKSTIKSYYFVKNRSIFVKKMVRNLIKIAYLCASKS